MANTHPTLPAVDDGKDPKRWLGREIEGRYRVVELLGEGGMGAVFVAEHLRLRKQVALKMIRAEFAANSQAAERFNREALATAQLDHPHVASAIDSGTLPDGEAYLVTMLVRGESLGKRLGRGPLTWPQACVVGAQIADALAAAHAIGIVHRDLKPDNILLEARDDGSLHARVVDFGIARVSGELGGAVADPTQPITRMGAVIGTPGYMAPEQAVGQQVDLRVDLYALGVIVWESVAGRTLFEAETLTELFAAQLSRPAPSLREVLPGRVPEALVGLVDRLLARVPADRPATASAVRDELRRLAQSAEAAGVAAGPAAASARGKVETAYDVTLGGVSGARTILSGGTGAPVEPRRRVPRAVWFAGGAVALLVAALALVGGEAEESEDKPARIGRVDKPAQKERRGRGLPSVKELVAEVPEAYAAEAKVLLDSRNADARELAGETIAELPEAEKQKIPQYLRNLAWFEKMPQCETKLSILEKIEAEGDPRALPSLKIIAEAPTDGCGWFGAQDSLGCLRQELARTIAKFEVEVGG